MLQIKRLNFTIRHPGGTSHVLAVDSERALIGSSAYAEIRLPAEHAAPEVLLVENRNGGLFAEVRSFENVITLNGTPFNGGRLLADAVLGVGDLQITVEVVSGGASEGAVGGKQGKSSPVATIGIVLLLAASSFMLMFAPAPAADPPAPAAPGLWVEPAQKAACAERAPSPAGSLAQELLLTADGRRERAPFFFQDGVAAVSFYEKAAACFGTAGNAPAAKDAANAAQTLRDKLANDYHIHQIRLERALATQAYEQARSETKILLSFLQGRKDDYVTWLAIQDRTLELKYSGKKAS